MTAQKLPQPGETIAGKYRVERVLGTGGMGAVFEATHQVTGKRFAVKWLLPDLAGHADAIRRFIREAQVAGRFEHPNVVEVYDVGQANGSFFMVMELLQGESLAQRLRSRGRLSPAEACGLLIPCMRGVARAHEAGIVHRDLKPDNIFVCRAAPEAAEHPKVLDFGISKMADIAGEVNPSITKTGVVMGTPHYMAPEQIRGKAMDHRVDVYAFGVILYQLLSGQFPFPGDTYSELVLKIATEQPRPLREHNPTLPQDLIEIVARAMSREPASRYQTLEELAAVLEPYANGGVANPRKYPIGGAGAGAASASPGKSGSQHVRKATPSSGTIRLETPLSTESNDLPVGLETGGGRSWLVLGLSAVGLAVLALVIFAVVLLNREPEVAQDPSAKPPAASASAGAPLQPKTELIDDKHKPADEPVANTVRIAPEPPAPERKWEPPAPPADAPAAQALTAQVDEKPEPQKSATSSRKKSSKTHKREDTAEAQPTTATQAQPTTGKPATPPKPSFGRLGAQMEAEEF